MEKSKATQIKPNKDNLSILVVDDDSLILAVAVKVLNRLGYQKLETASNGYKALDLLTAPEATFNIIICDLNMPAMEALWQCSVFAR